jgi:hypothetical protein
MMRQRLVVRLARRGRGLPDELAFVNMWMAEAECSKKIRRLCSAPQNAVDYVGHQISLGAAVGEQISSWSIRV